MAHIVSNSEAQDAEYCKIPRQANRVAHRLAKHAQHFAPQTCRFECLHWVLHENCATMRALQSGEHSVPFL
jgi:hypothetical protein